MSALRDPAAPVPVSVLVAAAREIIEAGLPLMWVSGEVSNFTRAACGHNYFVMKDASAQVRCVFFRHKAALAGVALRDGLQIEARAQPTMYEARGEFQLNVETVRLAGAGALYERFLRLKAKLEAAGWFAPERKRALPAFPRCVGIVTSPRAAALRDVLTTLRRRMPSVPVILYPCAVQGRGSAEEIAAAIAAANARGEADVLIVCRGGGSIEDLWSFNEEVVARAVFESAIPVVSGVGHETDFTICDFVADARAPTPTAAAAMAVPDRSELGARLGHLGARLHRATERRLEQAMQRVDGLARRLEHPGERLRQQGEALARLAARMRIAWSRQAERRAWALSAARSRLALHASRPPPEVARLEALHRGFAQAGRTHLDRLATRVARLAQSLAHLNPEAVLSRGFAIVTTPEGHVVASSSQLAVGKSVRLHLGRGGAQARVEKVEE